MKRNVIVDVRCIFDSGIGIYLQELLKCMSEKCTVEIVLNKSQEDDFDKLDILISKKHFVDFGRFSYKNLYYFNRITKNSDCFFVPNLILTPMFLSCPILLTIHDICPISMKRFFGWKKSIQYYFLMGLQMFSATKVIAISKFTESEVQSAFPHFLASKVTVIYNGLSKRFTQEDDGIFKSIGDKPYMLCVGNIKGHKNVTGLVQHYAENKNLQDTLKLVVVGQSEGFRTGLNVSNPLPDSIVFTGYVSDKELSALYRQASLFVFPSFYEGFGLPLLEAMEYDLPILASNIKVFKEIAGNSIHYFEPDNFANFNNAFLKALSESHCGSKYREILDTFSWEKCAQAYIREIENENFTS